MYKIMEFRNTHPAFNGEVKIGEDKSDGTLIITWINGADFTKLEANFKDKSFCITYTDNGTEKVFYDQGGK